MVKDGTAVNVGRSNDNIQAAFKAGTVAMNLETTATLGNYLAGTQGKFEIGVGAFPKPTADAPGGTGFTAA